MMLRSARRGYAFLVTVLVIGTIAASAVVTLLLLGTSVLRATLSLENAAQAESGAMSCAERALQSLRNDLSYSGNETITLADGTTCRVLPLEGSGNSDRTICTEATAGSVIRRLEVTVDTVVPSTKVGGFLEVSDFSHCAS